MFKEACLSVALPAHRLVTLVKSHDVLHNPRPLKIDLGERGNPWNSIHGSIVPFVGNTVMNGKSGTPTPLPLKVGWMLHKGTPKTKVLVHVPMYEHLKIYLENTHVDVRQQ